MGRLTVAAQPTHRVVALHSNGPSTGAARQPAAYTHPWMTLLGGACGQGDAPREQRATHRRQTPGPEQGDTVHDGDGLVRFAPGSVVVVSDAAIGDQPLVRISTVRETVAFAEAVGASRPNRVGLIALPTPQPTPTYSHIFA